MSVSRRELIKIAVAGLGTLALDGCGRSEQNPFSNANTFQEGDEHFFLQVFIPGGFDPSYTFDARPLEMTKNNKAINYFNAEPTLYVGSNGGRCWTTSVAKLLLDFKDDFSILNGVVMSPAFDGHDQNINYFFAGDPFGGENFIPHINAASTLGLSIAPLDGVQSGPLRGNFKNVSGVVPLDPKSTLSIISKISSAPELSLENRIFQHVSSRAEFLSQGLSHFSRASRLIGLGLSAAPNLAERLKSVSLDFSEKDSDEKKTIIMLREFFKKGITRSGILSLEIPNRIVDIHAQSDAKNFVENSRLFIEKVVNILKCLKETSYDGRRSLADVTTFVVSSEFGRTLRQENRAIDDCGTDHNNLTNTMLIGGKGIRKGLIFGASDFQTSTEELSKAHLKLDANALKAMGTPFDFSSGLPRGDKPENFDFYEYLSMGSVVNTLYKLFSVKSQLHRALDRSGRVASIVNHLLA